MFDHLESILLTWLCTVGLVGLYLLCYHPPAQHFETAFTALSMLVGGAFSALYKGMSGSPANGNGNGNGHGNSRESERSSLGLGRELN